jgi:hypothetical protein
VWRVAFRGLSFSEVFVGVLTAVTSPAVLLACLLGGGVARAAGAGAVPSALVAIAMLVAATAGAVGAGGRPGRAGRFGSHSVLRGGTEQAALVAAFDGSVRDLQSLRASARLPDLLTGPAVEALVAARGARAVAVRVAEAVDALDVALDRAFTLGERVAPTPTSAAVLARMYDRRQRLLTALLDGLAQVQDVHAELLELSATSGVSAVGDVALEVREVGDRLEVLRRSFAELVGTAMASRPRA